MILTVENILIYYVAAIFENFMFFVSFDILLKRKIFKKKLLLIFLSSAMQVCTNFMIPIPVISWISPLIVGIVFFLIYINLSIMQDLLTYIFSFLIYMLIQSLLMFIPRQVTSHLLFMLPAFLISLGIFYLAVKFLHIDKLYNYLVNSNIIYKILLLNTFIFIQINNIYSKIETTSWYNSVRLYSVYIILVILINGYNIYEHIQIQKNQALLDAYNTWYSIVEQLIVQIRMIQHNYDNELQTFKALPLVHKNVDKLKKAILDYVRDIISQDIPMAVTLNHTPNAELLLCIQELNGEVEYTNNQYTVKFNQVSYET